MLVKLNFIFVISNRTVSSYFNKFNKKRLKAITWIVSSSIQSNEMYLHIFNCKNKFKISEVVNYFVRHFSMLYYS